MAKGVIYIYNGNTRRRREKVREETAETMMIENVRHHSTGKKIMLPIQEQR